MSARGYKEKFSLCSCWPSTPHQNVLLLIVLRPASSLFSHLPHNDSCSLDRTNVAQVCVGTHVLGLQMYSLGLTDSETLDPSGPLVRTLMGLYEEMGDAIAMQYGGSEANKKVTTDEHAAAVQSGGGAMEEEGGGGGGHQHKASAAADGDGGASGRGGFTLFGSSVTAAVGSLPSGKVSRLGGHSATEFLSSLQRYYANSFTDGLKQASINLFLGVYQPRGGGPHLWELETDFYLHNPGMALAPSAGGEAPLALSDATPRGGAASSAAGGAELDVSSGLAVVPSSGGPRLGVEDLTATPTDPAMDSDVRGDWWSAPLRAFLAEGLPRVRLTVATPGGVGGDAASAAAAAAAPASEAERVYFDDLLSQAHTAPKRAVVPAPTPAPPAPPRSLLPRHVAGGENTVEAPLPTPASSAHASSKDGAAQSSRPPLLGIKPPAAPKATAVAAAAAASVASVAAAAGAAVARKAKEIDRELLGTSLFADVFMAMGQTVPAEAAMLGPEGLMPPTPAGTAAGDATPGSGSATPADSHGHSHGHHGGALAALAKGHVSRITHKASDAAHGLLDKVQARAAKAAEAVSSVGALQPAQRLQAAVGSALPGNLRRWIPGGGGSSGAAASAHRRARDTPAGGSASLHVVDVYAMDGVADALSEASGARGGADEQQQKQKQEDEGRPSLASADAYPDRDMYPVRQPTRPRAAGEQDASSNAGSSGLYARYEALAEASGLAHSRGGPSSAATEPVDPFEEVLESNSGGGDAQSSQAPGGPGSEAAAAGAAPDDAPRSSRAMHIFTPRDQIDLFRSTVSGHQPAGDEPEECERWQAQWVTGSAGGVGAAPAVDPELLTLSTSNPAASQPADTAAGLAALLDAGGCGAAAAADAPVDPVRVLLVGAPPLG